MFSPCSVSCEAIEPIRSEFGGNHQLKTAPQTRRTKSKFAVIAGAAALALTLSACSAGADQTSETGAQATNSATSAGDGGSGDSAPGDGVSDDSASGDVTSGEESQPVVTSRPTTSLVDVPLRSDDNVLELDELPEIEEPELAKPEEAVAEVKPEVEELTPEQEPLDALKEIAEQTTTTAPPSDAKRDGYTRNDAGQLLILDDAANLACADVEIGLTALDSGDVASANSHISSASSRAGSSRNSSIASWSETLATASELDGESVSVLVGFIAVCAEGGYEI